ncbi:MAG TPA: PqqD family protein, partial [Candidatus Polarisedimenticolia bacterium]|nr:PqqD family protein [Candidatus Polarisedimenticolia bacterium]
PRSGGAGGGEARRTMSRTHGDTRFEPAPDVVSRRIAGEHLLVPVRSGAAHMDYLFTANEVGSFIFTLLDGRRDEAEIARLVSLEYEVGEERARADVAAFLDDLSQAGLVRPGPQERR